MIKHIVWDWNGTLIDDVELCVDILNHQLLSHGKNTITVKEYRGRFFFPVAKFYETLELPSFGSQYDLLAKRYIQEYRDRFQECVLHFEAISIVKKLESLGISQSILSAAAQSDLEKFTAFYGIDKWMSQLDGANNIEAKGKEDRAASHFSNLGYSPNQVLLVGDTLHDWKVAKMVDCMVLLFEGGHIDPEKLRKSSVPTIELLSEVVSWVLD